MRRIGKLLVVLAVVGTSVVLPARPSEAHNNVCTYDGWMRLAGGFGYPTSSASVTTTFDFIYFNGVCAPTFAQNPNKGGTITGWCGLATGTGVTADGHAFSIAWNGAVVTFTGELDGVYNVTDIPFDFGSDCAQGTGRYFGARGTMLMSHTTLPTDVCSGEFRMTLSVPFGTGVTQTASFSIQHIAGTCSGSTPISVSGTITGRCFVATGSGTSNSGATTTVDWWGTIIGFTGQLNGSAFIVEDPNTPTSCLTATETQFLLTGTLARF